jgi:hypothetical protein
MLQKMVYHYKITWVVCRVHFLSQGERGRREGTKQIPGGGTSMQQTRRIEILVQGYNKKNCVLAIIPPQPRRRREHKVNENLRRG